MKEISCIYEIEVVGYDKNIAVVSIADLFNYTIVCKQGAFFEIGNHIPFIHVRICSQHLSCKSIYFASTSLP